MHSVIEANEDHLVVPWRKGGRERSCTSDEEVEEDDDKAYAKILMHGPDEQVCDVVYPLRHSVEVGDRVLCDTKW